MGNVYFVNIENVISTAISGAEERIYVAVAWFTNKSLFDELLIALQRDIDIKVLILDDVLNRNEFGLDYGILANNGADIRFASLQKGIMHNKFCIIDNKVITGSYNWTYHANLNNENIVVIDESDIVDGFNAQFDNLFNTATHIALPYEHLKWTDINEGDFIELQRTIFRDVVAKNDENKELRKVKLQNLNNAYKSGVHEELFVASSLPIEQQFRTITDVLTSPDKKYKGELYYKQYWDLEKEPADARFSKIGKWIFIPDQFGESNDHRKYIRGSLHYYDWMKRKQVLYKKMRIEIYDESFISAIKKYMNGNDISKIPDRLICIDLAKLSIYKLPVENNTKDEKLNTIVVFCIVKEIYDDKIVYYAGWDPITRGERIAKILQVYNEKSK
jgi:hypothetical protein